MIRLLSGYKNKIDVRLKMQAMGNRTLLGTAIHGVTIRAKMPTVVMDSLINNNEILLNPSLALRVLYWLSVFF